MKRTDIENLFGKKVKIEFFDEDTKSNQKVDCIINDEDVVYSIVKTKVDDNPYFIDIPNVVMLKIKTKDSSIGILAKNVIKIEEES